MIRALFERKTFVCTDAKTAERTYGREMADKIHQRIDEINAADLLR